MHRPLCVKYVGIQHLVDDVRNVASFPVAGVEHVTWRVGCPLQSGPRDANEGDRIV
jgi:hypothetical protein